MKRFISDDQFERRLVQVQSASADVIPPELRRDKDPVLISCWIPKGGVGKTTTTFTLSHVLAENGYKILLVDCDSQRDLSQVILTSKFNDAPYNGDYSKYLSRPGKDGTPNRTLHQMLMGLHHAPYALSSVAVPEVIKESTDLGGSIHLLAGHRDMDTWDSIISVSEATIGSFATSKDQSGAPFEAIMRVARSMNADIVLIDLPPGKGALTRCILMASDYFLVPTKADYFSFEAVESLVEKIVGTPNNLTNYEASWTDHTRTYVIPKTATGQYPFPLKTPKLLGYVINGYTASHKNVMQWGLPVESVDKNIEYCIHQLHDAFRDGVARLRTVGILSREPRQMAFDETDYHRLNIVPFLLGKFRDFGQLQSLSHVFGVPVPFLQEHHLVEDKGDGEFQPMKPEDVQVEQANIDQFRQYFNQFAWGILSLISNDMPDGRIGTPHDYGGSRPADVFDEEGNKVAPVAI
jgi:cellulose biosynthesis protein BcsQ